MRAIINKPSESETIRFKLIEEQFPKAFQRKVNELINECGMTEEEARSTISKMEFCMELVYHEGYGLFLVESDAVESGEIYSPYDARICTIEEEEEDDEYGY